MPATRRRRLPLAGSPSSSSSRSHSHGHERSLIKTLNSHINKWLKIAGASTGKKDHSLRPPASFQVKTTSESESDAEDGKRSSPLATTVALKALVSARVCSALWSNIQDCDEVFNYWEPNHFLLTGRGFQTWEYSPVFAIRSYAYIWLYTLPALIFSRIFETHPTLLFYIVRLIMAICCSFCEVYFLKGISNVFGPFVGRICFAIQLFSTGLFISSSAFLPSSFSMYMTYLVFGAWMNRQSRWSITSTLVSIFAGWPFAGIISLPVGLHMVLSSTSVPGASRKKTTGEKIIFTLKYLVKWTMILAIIIATPIIVVDSIHYGKLVVASVNIVIYNVFSSRGSQLYGTEPWYFYPFNLFLNFNLIFIFSIICLPLCVLVKLISRWSQVPVSLAISSYHLVVISSLFLWFLVFIPQAHKEERFMFPIFPLLCLTASLSLNLLHQFFSWLLPRSSSFVLNVIFALLLLSAAVSVSRGVALFKGYHAPLDVYSKLESVNDQLNKQNFSGNVHLCVGKEWHRFPSSFFLPDPKWKLQFLKSQFSGLLPKPYDETLQGVLNITRFIPTEMNDENHEEPGRYFETTACHFIIDSDYLEHAPLDYPYSKDTNTYEVVTSETFLDSSKTPFPWRSFYLPILSEKKWFTVNYNLLKNVNLTLNFDIKV